MKFCSLLVHTWISNCDYHSNIYHDRFDHQTGPILGEGKVIHNGDVTCIELPRPTVEPSAIVL